MKEKAKNWFEKNKTAIVVGGIAGLGTLTAMAFGYYLGQAEMLEQLIAFGLEVEKAT